MKYTQDRIDDAFHRRQELNKMLDALQEALECSIRNNCPDVRIMLQDMQFDVQNDFDTENEICSYGYRLDLAEQNREYLATR